MSQQVSTRIITNRDFIVVEQCSSYCIPHLFRDKSHFKAWRTLRGQGKNIVAPGTARGRRMSGYDHKGEIDRYVDDLESDMRDGTVGEPEDYMSVEERNRLYEEPAASV